MPQNSDLVTDLPADFEVFGQAVATSMADLLGGTTGQILSKATNADMDFTWITNDQGDITAVTAGTGISGGGTSGAVTITNSMATAITTAGDLIKGTGSGTFDRLGIGSTGQVLTVAAGAPSWATPATAPTIKTVRKSSDQTVTSSTTLVNDSQLKFAIAANETYIFEAWLYTYAADGTPDIKVTFTSPAGSTLFWSSSQVIFLPDASTSLTVVAPAATTGSLFIDSNLRAIQLYGSVLNGSTAGDVQFQFAQNTSSANGTSVKAGSYIYGIKVS
jgi:hypothetical protein